MSKLQQLAQRRAATPGGISRLLGAQRREPTPKTFPQQKRPLSTVEPEPVVEPEPTVDFVWEVPPGSTKRISHGVQHPLAKAFVVPTPLDPQITISFTNKPVKVTKPKKKKKKKTVVVMEDDIEPKMAKLTIIPKSKPQPSGGKPKVSNETLITKSQSPTLSFITIGHVDSGKSTTLGRFLYDTNVISGRQLNTLAKQAKDAGKGSFSLAWVMDQTPEERSRGVTVDTVQCQVEINGRKLVLVDSPGHQDYLPSVVNGVIGADVAVVIVDSSNDLIFNLSSKDRIHGAGVIHTREQLLIAKSLGISKILVLVNKLDSPSYEDSQMKFENIVNAIKDTLLDTPPIGFGFNQENLEFVPISGINGDNIVNPSTNMPWYTGGTMLNILESWWDEKSSSSHVNIEDPFIFNITDVINSSSENTNVSKVKDNEVIAFGRVHSGYIQQGDVVVDSWGGERGQVDGIWSQQSKISGNTNNNDKAIVNDIKVDERTSETIATRGDFIELKLKKVGTPQNITIGDVITKDKVINCQAQTVFDFIIDVDTFDLQRPLLIGSPIVIFRGGRAYDGQIQSIEYVVVKSPTSGKLIKKKNRNHLGSNQKAQIIIHFNTGMGAILINGEISSMDKLNRVVLRKDSKTVAGGLIKSIILKDEDGDKLI